MQHVALEGRVRSRHGARRATVALVVVAAALASLFGAASPAGAAPAPVNVGALDWGVKASFRSYVAGSGTITLSAGATENGDGTYRFPAVTGGTYDSATGATTARFGGGVRFLAQSGALDVAISNIVVTTTGTTGTLVADVVSKPLPSQEAPNPAPVTYDDVVLATVGPVTAPTGRPAVWTAVPAALASTGVAPFAGFYPAGTALDPITVSLDTSPAVGLNWRISDQAFTSSSLTPLHTAAGGVVKRLDTWVWPAPDEVLYNADTGALRVAFTGTVQLGNTAQGNYRIRIANPVLSVDAAGAGTLAATVSYGLVGAEPGAGVSATVATFTLPDEAVTDTGSNLSFTVTPDFIPRTDLNPNPNGWKQFPQSFLNALDPSLISHFRQTSGANTVTTKAPSPIVVDLPYEAATIAVTGLEQTWDGTPRPVTVTTDPAGLDTVVTYDGGATVPTAPGTYAVSVALDEELASATPFTGTLTIAKADQTITFDELPDAVVGDDPFTVAATASSGLPVSFAATGACTVAESTVTLTGPGTCTVTASQAGDANRNAAPSVERSFEVLTSDREWVQRAFQVILGRDADESGEDYWVGVLDDGVSRDAVGNVLAVTGEARNRLVDLTYQRVFGRSADTAGRDYWAGRVRNGLSAEDLLATLMASPEAYTRAGGTPEGAAADLYRVHLGRDGDSGGIAYWAGRIGAANTIAGRRAIARGFGRSPEATAVAVRRAVTAACTSGYTATGPQATTLAQHWVATGRHPLRLAATALALVCPDNAVG